MRVFHQYFVAARRLRYYLTLCVLLVLGLSGCASTPPPADRASQPVQATMPEEAVAIANNDQLDFNQVDELDPSLPKLDLSASDLADLLVMNIASMHRDWKQAASSAYTVAQRTRDHRVARLATMMYLQERDHAKASTAAILWAELQPENRTAADMKLVALVGDDKIDQAIATIEGQLGTTELDLYVRELAGLLVRQGNATGALSIAQYLTEANPQSAQVHTSSAFIAEHFEDFERGEQWSEIALQLRPEWDLAAQMKARILQSQGKQQARAEFIADFVKRNPKSIGMRISHAAELSRQEDYRSAYEVMLGVVEDAPNDVDALQYTGNLAEQLQDNAGATKWYRRALRQAPGNDDVRWSLARLAVLDEKFVAAERLFNDIQSDDLYVRAQIQVANMRNETQGFRMAVNTLKAIQPRNRQEFIQIAITKHYLLMDAHEYQEALASINETLVFLPEEPRLLYARALVAAQQDQVELAEQDLRKVISLEPGNANAMNALGYTLADQTDRFEEAKELIEAALSLRPEDAHILDSMGWVLYKLNEFEQAIEFLTRAAEKDENPEILAHLGEVLWESGQKSEAIDVWQQGFDADAKHPALLKTLERYEIDLRQRPQA